ncbi:MAG: TIGR04255 family protein [Dysgonamonadaceae bacterium]|jgi:uncharacterized protein (TIGR04255 family)|nr:TIGR04255 family protein [Dysgonamonadaceae bacterium]
MESQWPNLNVPPVILSIFQIKYQKEGIKLNDFLKYDTLLKRKYLNRIDNYHANIDMPRTFTPGISTVTGKADTKINSYTYFSKDHKQNLIIEETSITYTDENKYTGWENFKQKSLDSIEMFHEILNQSTIKRISIRFVNRFSLEYLSDPLEYFTTTISSAKPDGLPYPLVEYAFKLKTIIPDTNIYSYINQTTVPVNEKQTDYIFDIDILELTDLLFDKDLISDKMEKLREIKNNLFFNSLTQKAINLCN